MPRVSHYFVTDRPLEAVFDIVTTARFWTEWHPATRSVEGDVDHPAQLGDQITEYVRIAGIEGSGTWTVVEHDRPHRLALETDLGRGAVPYCGGLPSRRGHRGGGLCCPRGVWRAARNRSSALASASAAGRRSSGQRVTTNRSPRATCLASS